MTIGQDDWRHVLPDERVWSTLSDVARRQTFEEAGFKLPSCYKRKKAECSDMRGFPFYCAWKSGKCKKDEPIQQTEEAALPRATLVAIDLSDKCKLDGTVDLPPNRANIGTLKISCHLLRSLPDSIGDLKSLTELDLSYCLQLTSLPERFGECKSLTSLNLSFCRSLVSLPDSIGDLTSLTELDLGWCENLVSLPDRFGDLKALQILNMAHCRNKLESLPHSFGDLTSLTKLDLYGCTSLVSLPNMKNLNKLNRLNLRRCIRLETLPSKLIQFYEYYDDG